MAWQFTTQQPIYQQLVDEISMRIFNGTYPLGERLPSVRELAVVAAVNPNTMQRALSELESRSLVSTQRTSGRTVTTDEAVIRAARDRKARQLCGTFLSQMYALGMDRQQTFALLTEQEPDQQPSKEDGNGTNS